MGRGAGRGVAKLFGSMMNSVWRFISLSLVHRPRKLPSDLRPSRPSRVGASVVSSLTMEVEGGLFLRRNTRRRKKKRRTRKIIPPVTPPTIGPHFLAADGLISSSPSLSIETGGAEEEDEAEGVEVGDTVKVCTSENDRERVMDPVAMAET